MDLRGRKAVVTGGGRGIGAGVARALCAQGAGVLLAARTQGQVDQVAAELRAAGFEAHGTSVDVADPASVAALRTVASERLGNVDILINNAGVASSANIKVLTLEEWNRVMAINATGTFLCTQAFIGAMLERGWGRIVNVASVAARQGAPYISAYAASKHAVLGFTRSVAAEVATRGVTVNAVCPGYVDTDMTESAIAGVLGRSKLGREEALAAILKSVSQKRLVSVDEVAYVVASLCGELASGTTAQAVVIDAGGLTA